MILQSGRAYLLIFLFKMCTNSLLERYIFFDHLIYSFVTPRLDLAPVLHDMYLI